MMKRLKIVAETSVPYIRGVVEQLGEVTYLLSTQFTAEAVRDADWLIIRSNVKCTRDLLEGSRVQLITSATIGFDHIDTAYCQQAGIRWYNAPGCNAEAVAQYFAAAMALLITETGYDPRGKVIGIVGVGNVGRRVERNARALGMEVLRNDPPRAELEGAAGFVSLHEIAERADIIAFHVPLTKEGRYKTHRLLDNEFVTSLRRQPIVMNACRGAVTDTSALLRGIESGQISRLIMDCWEGEPWISRELLAQTWLATPHIAGFSAQGKANGARVCVMHGLEHFQLSLEDTTALYPLPLEDPLLRLCSSTPLYEALLRTFDIKSVDRRLREKVDQFEDLRRSYDYPYEPSQYKLLSREIGEAADAASQLGFEIVEG